MKEELQIRIMKRYKAGKQFMPGAHPGNMISEEARYRTMRKSGFEEN